MNRNSHLTDEQMYDLLGQETHADPHVANCAACQSEFVNLRASLVHFRAAATSFAAAEAPSRAPRLTFWHLRTPALRSQIWAASLATFAAVLAVSVSALHTNSMPRKTDGTTTTPAAQVAMSAESDEALLDGIQQDLSTSIPPSLEPLTVPATTGETSTQD